jgi:RNA 2',3'-cyclic 3'-phosphodiesterase
MRAFLALDLPPSVRDRLQDLIRDLSSDRRRVKWCNPLQIHVTLKFFENLPEAGLSSVIDALSGVCGGWTPLTVVVKGAGFFGSGERIRVVWAGLEEPAGNLVRLQRALEEALKPLGFPPEGRPFHPHLTLGRLKEPARDPDLAQALRKNAGFEGGNFLADRLILYSSTLTPSGPIYRAVHSWPLEGTP